MNIFITLANIAVAITAIWALTKDNGEVQRLEDRVKKLEQVISTKEGTANPNIQQNTHYGQTNPKDSLTK